MGARARGSQCEEGRKEATGGHHGDKVLSKYACVHVCVVLGVCEGEGG